jgi:hypothetical protein
MAKVAETTTTNKVFYAHLHDQSGVLGKLGPEIIFLADDTLELTVIEPDMVNFLVVLGQLDLCDSQAAYDKLRGGYAKVCCTRLQGVA